MNAGEIFLIIFSILVLIGAIVAVIIILVRKSKGEIKFKSCNAQFGSSSDIIGVWKSDNKTAVVNMYASTSVLTFDSTGMPSSSSGAPIDSSLPPNTPISTEAATITSVQTDKSYNTYFVASDPNDITNFTVCGPIVVNASISNKKLIISAVDLVNKGGITRNSSNEITYIIDNNIAPTLFNTWFYNGTTPTTLTVSNKTETIPANTLSNTNSDGTRYYLYNDSNTLKSAILSTITSNLSNAQFIFTPQFNWTLSNNSDFGIGIAGTIVSGSSITFATPPNDSWINNVVS